MYFQKKRLIAVILLFFLFAFLIILRFFHLQIISHIKLEKFARKEYFRKITEISPRGKIYDINDNILADSIITWDVVITTSSISADEINMISKITSINKDKILKKIKSKTRYLKIKRNIAKEEYEMLKNIKSIFLEPHQSRIYPAGCAREIIGLANENNGLSGIELAYDKYLKGNLVIKEIIKDIKGNIIKVNEKEPEEDEPSNIYLTIEYDIQSIVEHNLEKHAPKLDAERIIVLIQNAQTGSISAAASYPSNTINFIPFEYVYEPGSTIKSIVLSAAFEENAISEKDYIYCENGSWKINSKHTITDHEKLGNISLSEVFKHSSNIGFAKIGLKLGIERLYPYIKKFGFGTKYTSFPGESKGIIKDLANYREIDLITTSYGYGIAVTPLQLLNAYTAIANRGKLLNPYFISKIEKNGEIIEQTKPSVIRQVITPQTAERVIKNMIEVVDNGTGINARINGYTIAGKTGTANKLDLKTYKYIKGLNVGSFCGFFPVEKPLYTILVIVDSSKKFKYGGQTAAPIFHDIAKQIISIRNIEPDRPFDKEEVNKIESIVN